MFLLVFMQELHSIVHGSDDMWRAAWELHVSSAAPKSLEGVSERTTCKQRYVCICNHVTW